MRKLIFILFLFSGALKAQDTLFVKTINPVSYQEEVKKIAIGKGLNGKDGKDGKDATGASEVIQSFVSGNSVTVNQGTTWMVVNPATVLNQLTIFLPTSGNLLITFGGTIKTGTVIKSISIIASGQTILQSSSPTIIQVGDVLQYKYFNNFWYRIN